MKNHGIKLMLVAMSLFMSLPAYSAETIHVKANGLVCDFCARAMEKMFRQRPEVKDLNVNLTTKQIQIELKEGQTLDDETVRKLVSESGYGIDTIERS